MGYGGDLVKFIHIGDLHLGKWICGHSMIAMQKEVLFELLTMMDQQDIRLLLIAGDVYDRLVPPIEAVELFDDFLTAAIRQYHIRVLMISGNHDSDERLNFASQLLKPEGLYIASKLQENWETCLLEDEYGDIEFHLLPYIKPSQVKALYPEVKVKTYQEALAQVISQHPLEPKRRHVLITHQFVAGGQQVQTSESETILSVGGSEVVDVHLFDNYDYVALGHLHAPQAVSRQEVRYCGSLLRYSFDEVKQNKTVCKVEMKEKGDTVIEQIPLHPTLTMQKYSGYFAEFIDETKNIIENKQDYIAFELLDDSLIANAMERLRMLYPNAMQLTYKQLLKEYDGKKTVANLQVEKQDDFTLFKAFYQTIRDHELDDEKATIIANTLEKAKEIK